jgi:hypothetical protein
MFVCISGQYIKTKEWQAGDGQNIKLIALDGIY